MKNDPGLFERAQSGDLDARNQLIEENIGLCRHFAYRIPWKMPALDADDLVLAGVFGLIEAIMRFDCGRGTSFSTYAGWYIIAAIQKEIEACGSAIARPWYYLSAISIVHREVSYLNQLLQREPTVDEVWQRVNHRSYMKLELVEELMSGPLISSSLDFMGQDGESCMVSELVQDEETPFEHQVELRACIQSMLDRLESKQRQLIVEHYGLNHEQMPLSYREMAPLHGCSHEWVRHQEQIALASMRAMIPEDAWSIHDYLR